MTQTIDAPLSSTVEGPNATSSEYDFVVLGTGEGAKYIAWTLAKEGHRVASIERKYIGGSCPNIACLPSKNVIHSALRLIGDNQTASRDRKIVDVRQGLQRDAAGIRG